MIGTALNVIHLPHVTSWIIDFGAIDHIVSPPLILSDVTYHCSKTIKLRNEVDASITHIGKSS